MVSSLPMIAWDSYMIAVAGCMSVHLMQSQMRGQQWFAIALDYTGIRAASCMGKNGGRRRDKPEM